MGIGPFITAVLGAGPVNAIVGPRVYDTSPAQQTEVPYIVFEEFDGTRYSQMGTDATICESRVRFHLWTVDQTTRDALWTAVRQALQRYSGAAAGIQVDDIMLIPGGPNFGNVNARLFHAVRDFRVYYRESGPTES